MSMYNNKFIMCVLVDGRPQKELANGEVRIPFGAQYTLRFRNKHNRRAVVDFTIDGENVSGGGYVIDANSHIDIKRHSDVDRSFKFVALDSEDAIDHGKNGSNPDRVKGTIVANFRLEKEQPVVKEVHHHHDHYYPVRPIYPKPWLYPYDYNISCANDGGGGSCSSGSGGGSAWNSSLGASGQSFGLTRSHNSGMLSTCGLGSPKSSSQESCLPIQDSVNLNEIKDGCTVEGGYTGQNFHTVHIDVEDNVVTLRIFLQGYDNATCASTPAKPRRSHKNTELNEIEAENERLRQQIAEAQEAAKNNDRKKALLDEQEKLKEQLTAITLT